MIARSVGTFVQVGENDAYNMSLIVQIAFQPEYVCFYYLPNGRVPVVLKGDERLAFLDWWERRAKITRAAQSRYLAGG